MINLRPKKKPDPFTEPLQAVARSIVNAQAVMQKMLRSMTMADKYKLLAAASCDDGEIQIRIRAHRGDKASLQLWMMLAGSDTEGVLLVSSDGPVVLPTAEESAP